MISLWLNKCVPGGTHRPPAEEYLLALQHVSLGNASRHLGNEWVKWNYVYNSHSYNKVSYL